MEEDKRRNKGPFLSAVLSALGAGTTAFYLYTAYFGQFTPMIQRGIILLTCLVFCYMNTPMFKKRPRNWTFSIDCFLALLSAISIFYLMWREMALLSIVVGTPLDLVVGTVVLILVLEATRRTLGWALVIIPILFLIYGSVGPYMPEVIRHSGFKLDYLLTWIALTPRGIFGTALYVCSTVIILFIAFSAFLRISGAIRFFTDLPFALFGRVRGGPAKIAVVGSSLFGMLSGSVVANVSAIGTFTIPLMKRTGYTATMAGAIEAVASTGGQIMPPVMGTAAFVMAEILDIRYWDVCVAAFIPAFLYYISLFVAVDLEAVKRGIKGIPKSELPNFRKTLTAGWYLLPSLFLLIYLLTIGWSPMKACLYAIFLTLILSLFSKEYRMGPRKIYEALSQISKDMILVTIACASAGIIIGMVGLTSLGVGIATVLEAVAGKHILLLLALCMILCTIFGMGMTTLAAYLILALLVAPVMVKLGLLPIAAHLFIFYYACLSMITPPVAIGAYAAAGVAGSEPMRTGFMAWRIALLAFIVPYFFVYNPVLLMKGSPMDIVIAFLTATAGTVCFGMMIDGYLYTQGRIGLVERLLVGLGGLALVHPGHFTDIIGVGLVGSVFVFNIVKKKLYKGEREHVGHSS
jgi:TRAP transporter 4TM/12TM fusion protein